MPRKRGSSSCQRAASQRAASQRATSQRTSSQRDSESVTNENNLECGSSPNEFNGCIYYRPGCYCTPQVLQPNVPMPYSYTQSINNFHPMHWITAVGNVATYMVDACGLIYYFNDFEHMFQLPRVAVETETEITYHYDGVTGEAYYTNIDEDASHKRGHFDEAIDNNDNDDKPDEEDIEDENDNNTSPRRYRAKEGYIVEEPSEEDTTIVKK